MNAPLLEVRDVSFAYTAPHAYAAHAHLVLESVNLTLCEGDFWAVIGPNGGGKTTLMKLILGLLKPQSGTITLSPTLQHAHIGYVSQVSNFSLDFPISVRDVITLGLLKPSPWGFRGQLCAQTEEKIQAIMSRLEITHLAKKPIGALSGGQRQRVLIAQAIVCEPKLLILDEPTANVDAKAQEGIYELLKALNDEMSIMIVSHDIAFTLGYATQVLYVNGYALRHEIPQGAMPPHGGHICEVDLLSLYASRASAGSSPASSHTGSHTGSHATPNAPAHAPAPHAGSNTAAASHFSESSPNPCLDSEIKHISESDTNPHFKSAPYPVLDSKPHTSVEHTPTQKGRV